MSRPNAPPLPEGEVERRRRRRPGEGCGLSGQGTPLTLSLSPWERGPALRSALVALLVLTAPASVAAQLAPYTIVGDAIPASLTDRPGDPARGRALVTDRTRGLCLLCHSGPFPEERFQGTLSPGLAGAGSRATAGQLRLRLVDGRKLNPDTIMPSYYRLDGLERVGPAWRGRTILDAGEIEDVVAFLATLTE